MTTRNVTCSGVDVNSRKQETPQAKITVENFLIWPKVFLRAPKVESHVKIGFVQSFRHELKTETDAGGG